MACSTIVEYSQQKGFYRVPLPAARQTPNLDDQWFRTFQLSPPGFSHVWNDASKPQQRKVELWARNCREFCQKVATSTSLLGSFICPKFTTWYRRLYFPSEGRRAVDFFARKIRQLRPGLNPRTWVPKASTLTCSEMMFLPLILALACCWIENFSRRIYLKELALFVENRPVGWCITRICCLLTFYINRMIHLPHCIPPKLMGWFPITWCKIWMTLKIAMLFCFLDRAFSIMKTKK